MKTETELASVMCFLKKLDDGQSSKKIRFCHLTSVILCSLFWISWTLKVGLICCAETSVGITAQCCMIFHKSGDLRWWFGSADLGLALHGTVQSWFTASYANLRWPNIFKHQI